MGAPIRCLMLRGGLLFALVLPFIQFLLVLGIALKLEPLDFRRLLVKPRALVWGLVAQLLLLPVLALMLGRWLALEPPVAVGLVLLAACPGGPAANAFTWLARGDLALSVFLTPIGSLITVFTIPVIMNLALGVFMDTAKDLSLPFLPTIGQIALMRVLPLGLGVLLRQRVPGWSKRWQRPLLRLAVGLMVIIVAVLIVQQWSAIVPIFRQSGVAGLQLNLLGMVGTILVAAMLRLPWGSCSAIAFGTGIKSVSLAITIAASPLMLNMPLAALPAASYGLLMYFTGLLLAILCRYSLKLGQG